MLAKTTVVRFRAIVPSQPAEEPAVAQPAVRRLVGPDQSSRPRSPVGGVPAGGGASNDAAGPRRPDQEPRDRVAGAAGRRQPDADRVAAGLRRQPLERDGQVGPSLGRHQRVNLVDDDVLDAAPVRVPARLAQQAARGSRAS